VILSSVIYLIFCGDSMNWLVRDAVLCMLHRDEDNNMAALKRYLMYRFPQIPEQFRDVIIVSAFTAAQKVALTYFDTLQEGTTERSIWAKNYLRKWSHGMSACEPVLKYIPSTKTTLAPENTQLYSPVNNYLLTREFPVSYESQKREFDRVTEQIVANAPVASSSNQADVNKHPVTEVLVSVAENLLALSSTDGITVPEGNIEQPSKLDLPMEDVAVVPNVTTVAECSNVSNAIPSMPDLSEFMPVIVNGQVQPVNMENLCEVEPMEEGNVPSSPVVDTFTQLLKVDGAHCLLLEEMTKPMLELVSPISSPNVLDDRGSKVVAEEKDSAVISTPVLADKSNKRDKVLTHTVCAEVHSESDKVTKKSEGGAVAKENAKSHNIAPKVASTCKKVNPNQRKKRFAPSVV